MSYSHVHISRKTSLLLLSTVLASGLATPAIAQIAPPPVRSAIDENGVDVINGTFNVSQSELAIGADSSQGMVYQRTNNGTGWWNNLVGTINQSGIKFTVTLNGVSNSFLLSGSVYTPTEANGATLTKVSNVYTYTDRNGLVATFAAQSDKFQAYSANAGRITSITHPNGAKLNFTYQVVAYCQGGIEEGTCPGGIVKIARLLSVNNTNGYQVKFKYVSDALSEEDVGPWLTVQSVSAVNNGVEYCAPTAFSCSFVQNWPTVSYSHAYVNGTGQTTVTDPAGQQTRYTNDSTGKLIGIKRPSAATDNIQITYGAVGVSQINNEGLVYTYNYADSGFTRTTTVTAPNSTQRIYTSNTSIGRVTAFQDELSRVTAYQYDANGRVTRITSPEGNYTEYTYDARGNVVQTRNVAKPGSGLADVVTSSSYSVSCTNTKTCNFPNSSTDALGRVTDYAYNATHGGLTTVTLPAATVGGIRPQKRIAYTGMTAYFKNSAGSIVSSGQTTYLPSQIAACQTTASCVGGADETKATISYGPQTAGVANNLLPVSTIAGSGNGALSATVSMAYDNVGNRTSVDGPLSGAADTTKFRYDAARRTVGVVAPDSDGAGALVHQAQRITYNNDGQIATNEVGTVTDQSDAAWSAFASQQQVVNTYDANARLVKSEAKSGGTTFSVTHMNYDSMGRVDCTAQRMDPAQWSGQTDACMPQTTNTVFGPDRVNKTTYTAAGEVAQVQTAVGTTEVAAEIAYTYSNNGQTATIKDAENNLTSYVYDGHDRLSQTRYPSTTKGSNASNTSDFEQLSYDANSNITQRRLRDGQLINFTYDNLGRMSFKDLPNSGYHEADVSYSYDLLGRMTAMTASNGHYMNHSFDALGRMVSEASSYGAKSMQYDLAGRMTRLTWPDANYVNYDYDVTGNVTQIRENGATSGLGLLATYAYDSLGRRTSVTNGNGTTTSYAFDPLSRLSSLTNNLGGTANDLTTTFGYNPAGQIDSLTKSNDGYAWGAHYNIDRLYGSNGLNQLSNAGATALSYDARGNLSQSGSSTYSYTSDNKLAVTGNGAYLANDMAGRLVQVYANGGANVTPMDYLGDRLITEMNGQNQLIRRYVPGPGVDETVVWYEGAGLSDRRWLHADERGSITAITDNSGNAIAINRYDEYGIPASTNIGRFQYTGQAWLPEIGMYYYKARIYSPTLGRFLQTDPIGYGDGMNLYNYVGGDPVNFSDPTGLEGTHPGWDANGYPGSTLSSGLSPTGTGYVGPGGTFADDPAIIVNGRLARKGEKNPGPSVGLGTTPPPGKDDGGTCPIATDAVKKDAPDRLRELTAASLIGGLPYGGPTPVEHGFVGGFNEAGKFVAGPMFTSRNRNSVLQVQVNSQASAFTKATGIRATVFVHSHPSQFGRARMSGGDSRSAFYGQRLVIAVTNTGELGCTSGRP